ncbi:MAG: hypothetical protein IKQ46_07905 [Bacteroidales bacterium]|nr:hypothetical protein [Bacteroidales bacterium]
MKIKKIVNLCLVGTLFLIVSCKKNSDDDFIPKVVEESKDTVKLSEEKLQNQSEPEKVEDEPVPEPTKPEDEPVPEPTKPEDEPVLEPEKVEEESTTEHDEDFSYVDFELSDGLLWATCNVGAKTPVEVGDYFAWGDVEPKDTYVWENCSYYDKEHDSWTKYNSKGVTLDLEDDAAHHVMGGDWRMPTIDEWQTLYEECYWCFESDYYGKIGYVVYKSKDSRDKKTENKSGKKYSYLSDTHIFLPVGQYMDGKNLCQGSYGFYWSSSSTVYSFTPCNFSYYYDFVSTGFYKYRCYGMPIRAVKSKS